MAWPKITAFIISPGEGGSLITPMRVRMRNLIEMYQETNKIRKIKILNWIRMVNGLGELDNSGKWVCLTLCVSISFHALKYHNN